ncbi:hypothetical protein BO86DRAFT_82710 [Aspergillus japonicus CBS 114.51]|uniref:Protein kinase domain-containing protein n=1 Tax=Aspergillus japonicus CBS 114.51 TaxID=1448312 RepID=A0A8T8X2K6_ASPJA|nr:hypothetical protein BO86DRAFT_82710 [Aspergillus japonicus CBS 114.51]RAH82368.1 hypothetical protein BO86DRAFT_82710 [Aspergillus japonicus CBS 114.51]
MDVLSGEQLYEKYGRPHHEPVVCLDERPLPDGVPANAVVPIWLGKASECVSLAEAHVVVTDYGESFMPATSMRHHSNTPYTLVPPEMHFEPEESLSFPGDIWTLACTIWTLVGQRPLFQGLTFLIPMKSLMSLSVAAHLWYWLKLAVLISPECLFQFSFLRR